MVEVENPLPDPASISDRNSFCAFTEALAQDLRRNRASWENADLGRFLEALAAYLRDVDGYYANHGIAADPERPTWRLFADVLLGARVYE